MDFGTFLLMQSPSARTSQEIYSRGVEVAQAAEALGFRNVWLAEHHFSTYGYLSRPAQLATYIAAKTTRLRVGTAVIVVPLHHPLVVAEEIATLDLLSGGRPHVRHRRLRRSWRARPRSTSQTWPPMPGPPPSRRAGTCASRSACATTTSASRRATRSRCRRRPSPTSTTSSIASSSSAHRTPASARS